MATVCTMYVGFHDGSGNNDSSTVVRNRKALFSALNAFCPDGYTVFDGVGCFHGETEPSAVVVFIIKQSDDLKATRENIYRAADTYRKVTNQQEVWITERLEGLQIFS